MRGRGPERGRHGCQWRGGEGARTAPDLSDPAQARGQHDQGWYGRCQGRRGSRRLAWQQGGDQGDCHEHRSPAADQQRQGAGPAPQLASGAGTGQRVGEQPGGEPDRDQRAGENEVRNGVHIDSVHLRRVQRNRVITGLPTRKGPPGWHPPTDHRPTASASAAGLTRTATFSTCSVVGAGGRPGVVGEGLRLLGSWRWRSA
jgi:hypothetical protein